MITETVIIAGAFCAGVITGVILREKNMLTSDDIYSGLNGLTEKINLIGRPVKSTTQPLVIKN